MFVTAVFTVLVFFSLRRVGVWALPLRLVSTLIGVLSSVSSEAVTVWLFCLAVVRSGVFGKTTGF